MYFLKDYWQQGLNLNIRSASFTKYSIQYKIPAQFGAIAQLGERNTGSVEVSGSIPLSSTNFLFVSIP